MVKLIKPVCSALFLLAILGRDAHPQSWVTGQTIDPSNKLPIAGVRVSAHDEAGKESSVVLTDSSGHFFLQLAPGRYLLKASRIGYASTESKTFELEDFQRILVTLHLGVQPIGVDPLVVVSRRSLAGRLVEYYDRLDRAGLAKGRFITRAQIDSVDAPGITDHMEHAGVPMAVNRRGEKWPTGVGRCRMRVFLDDVEIDGFVINELTDPSEVEGVEIYRSAYEAPAKYSSRMNTCGVVLIWTRMDKRDSMPLWKALVAGTVGVAAAILLRAWWVN
jgi:hypothetical protein